MTRTVKSYWKNLLQALKRTYKIFTRQDNMYKNNNEQGEKLRTQVKYMWLVSLSVSLKKKEPI